MLNGQGVNAFLVLQSSDNWIGQAEHIKLTTKGSLRSWRSCEKSENSMRRIQEQKKTGERRKFGGEGMEEERRMTSSSPLQLFSSPQSFLLNSFNMVPEIEFELFAFSQDRQLRRLD